MSLGGRRWNQRGKHLWKLATHRFLSFKRKKKKKRWEVWRKKEVRDECGWRRGFTFQLFQTPPSYITMFKEGWFGLLKHLSEIKSLKMSGDRGEDLLFSFLNASDTSQLLHIIQQQQRQNESSQVRILSPRQQQLRWKEREMFNLTPRPHSEKYYSY